MTTAKELAAQINAALKTDAVQFASDDRYTTTFISTGLLPIDILFNGGIPRGRFVEIYGDYCLAGQTKILCADLTWRRLDELHVGDEIVGFDEQENGRQRTKYRRATVTSIGEAALPTYEIVNDQGEITYASDGHLWLVRRPGQRQWVRTDELVPGDKIVWFGSPWDTEDGREAGYLAGMYDGEGWCSDSRVGFGQKDGVVLDNVRRLLEARGFDVRTSANGNGVKQLRFGGGKYEDLRLLGSIRPERLLENSHRLWEGKSTWSKISGTTEVQEVNFVGTRGVVTIGTSTRTLIADGMLSHNSTLKSYIGLMTIASYQKLGKVCAVIDTEHSFDSAWAESCGVDVKQLIIKRPETGEEAMDVCDILVRNGCDLIIFDSVAAMLPQEEQKKRLSGENVQPASIARLMSVALRRLTAGNEDCSIIWINQTRTNVGITFGSSESLPGGKALPYYASYRLSLRKVGKVTHTKKVHDGEKMVDTRVQTGQKFKAELTKSKLSKPFTEEWFTWDLVSGSLDVVGFLISQGLEHGFVTLKGSTWWLGNAHKAVGKDKFRKLIETNEEMRVFLENSVRQVHGIPSVAKSTVKTHSTSRGRSAAAKKPASRLRRK